jgi:hypothetical protein
MTLTTLAEQVEAAEAGSRELDLELGVLWPDPKPFTLTLHQCRGGKPPCPLFTEDASASRSLLCAVLPHAGLETRWIPCDDGDEMAWAGVPSHRLDKPRIIAESHTIHKHSEPRAVCAALLRALAEKEI